MIKQFGLFIFGLGMKSNSQSLLDSGEQRTDLLSPYHKHQLT
ncbi:hypothetical protein [Avibacterium sp. 21-586]|nr:hypothetical protein [Avibacterium sp. 21-586]